MRQAQTVAQGLSIIDPLPVTDGICHPDHEGKLSMNADLLTIKNKSKNREPPRYGSQPAVLSLCSCTPF